MATTDVSHASIPELISGVVNDAKQIASAHATKMRGEIKDEFSGLKRFLMKVAAAVGLGVLGGILLAHTLALVLDAIGLPMWLSYLIAAVVFVGIGAIFLAALPSSTKDIDLVPETTIADFRRDVKSIGRDVKSELAEPGQPLPAH